MNSVTNANFIHIGIVISIFAALIFLTYLAFIFSEKIVNMVGPNLISVVGKLMGLILAIIGIDMITEGIKLSFNL
jgi:multiple antibiotic resistance protein